MSGSSTLPRAATRRSAGRDPDSVLGALRSPRRLRIEVFAGLVTAFALIPECTSFAIAAGVGPEVGMFSAAVMAMAIAVTGGRRAMASGAAGSVALVLAPVMKEHGFDHLVVAVLLGGVIQIVLGVLGVARLMRYLPRSVLTGFVNGLAVLIFLAQVPHMIDVPWLVYPLIAVGLVIMVGLPRLTTFVPAPLVAIVVLSVLTAVLGWRVPEIRDEGALPTGWPHLIVPHVPLAWSTLTAILPAAIAMALVGLMESLMTATLVDDVTETGSDKRRESIGQGVANLFTGLFGGIGGCAMVGQTVVNVKVAGARTRVSTFLSGAFVLVLVVVLAPIVGRIPMAALVAVMVVVAASTFDWHSVRPTTLRRLPVTETVVMALTVVVTVVTENLALGVITGVLVALVVFARQAERLVQVTRVEHTDQRAVYEVRGNLFFASSNSVVEEFDYAGDPPEVVVDLSHAHVWDASTVGVMDSITTKYARHSTAVVFTGLNEASAGLHARTARESRSRAVAEGVTLRR